VYYDGGRWRIFNEDLAAMPVGIAFNVHIPSEAGTNAFRVTLAAASASAYLDHPLLNDNPCALPLVTNTYEPNAIYNTVHHALRYDASAVADGGRWAIESVDPGRPSFPAGASFHVRVDGPSATRCRDDALFTDGYETP
jgi:hypothetical protein